MIQTMTYVKLFVAENLFKQICFNEVRSSSGALQQHTRDGEDSLCCLHHKAFISPLYYLQPLNVFY